MEKILDGRVPCGRGGGEMTVPLCNCLGEIHIDVGEIKEGTRGFCSDCRRLHIAVKLADRTIIMRRVTDNDKLTGGGRKWK